jgi:hypothetical protein
MATPNLNLDHIEEGQTNKETTANAAFDGLDNAMNRVLEVAITGDVNLTEAQFRGNYLFLFTGTPGVDFSVTVPASISRQFSVANTTGNVAFIEFEDAASDAQSVASGATATFATNGTALYSLATGETGGGGSGAQGALQVENEGIGLGATDVLNFTGAGVTASENSDGTVDVVIPGGGGSSSTTITELTADFEITNTHLAGNVILEVNNGTDVFCFLEAGLTGTEPVTIIQTGGGQVIFTDASGVSILAAGGSKTRERYSAVTVIPRGSDEFFLVGDLAE